MSSSETDTEDELFLVESSYLKIMHMREGVHPINKTRKRWGEYHHLFHELKENEDRFFQYMRMTRPTFFYILNKVQERLTKQWTNWHSQPILPEERLVVTLRYLATGGSFKSPSFSFRMGASTVGKIVAETVAVLWESLAPQHMPIPSKEHVEKISQEYYELWNFPNVLGAIDGKHVRVRCPSNSGSMFFNYRNIFSIVLQAVADAKYKFTMIDVGGYGKQSDGGTFSASDLFLWLNNKALPIPPPHYLPNTNVKVPFVFIADDAYPILDCLMKPYKGANLPMDQECFNRRLSRARKTVECAFGILYSKWRVLAKAIETDVTVAEEIIKCICVLHNVIIDREGFERHLTEVTINFDSATFMQPRVGRPPNSATAIRDVFKDFVCKHPLTYT